MPAQRKIVVVGPAFPYRGGNALFVGHLAKALSAAFEVRIINFSRLYPALFFPGTRQTDVSGTAVARVESERLIDSMNPVTWYRAARRIRELSPDLLLIDWWNPFFAPAFATIARAARRAGIPIAFIAENVISHEGRAVDAALTRMALKHADGFLVLSDVVKSGIASWFPGRPTWQSALPIYDCYRVDGSLTQPEARKRLGLGDGKVILFFGYIRAYKGLDVLLRALPTVLRSLPEARLLVAGESYEKLETYTALIDRLGIADRVRLVNRFIPNEEVGLYYTASDVVALPYREATQSGILNIAYGFERPAVVANVGGLAEFVDEGATGFVVEPENPEALAAGLLSALARPVDSYASAIGAAVERSGFNSIIETIADMVAALGRVRRP